MSTSPHPQQATPSDDAMLAAWQQLRQRDWPTLAEIKRAAALYRLVHGQAMRKAQPAPAVQTPAPTAAPVQHAAGSVRVPHHPPIFDHKRAASGERDDD